MHFTGALRESHPAQPAAAPLSRDLFGRLRQATAPAHLQLEQTLGLLRPPLSSARFLAALSSFLGFHRAWEPALDRLPDLDGLRRGRSRIPALERDLAALGQSPATIAALPSCLPAAALASTLPRALGSLYVMEGSTLGGRVIAQALAGADWAPDGGLVSFGPYGADTGPMWRRLKTDVEALSSAADDAEIERAARDTFALLGAWSSKRTSCAAPAEAAA